jgi:hypothetical protein
MRKKKQYAPRRFGVTTGPHVDFNANIVLNAVKTRAAALDQSRYAYLKRILADAGFTDAPADVTWRQWEKRRKIAASWLPTILYATIVAGEKVTLRDLLAVDEREHDHRRN